MDSDMLHNKLDISWMDQDTLHIKLNIQRIKYRMSPIKLQMIWHVKLPIM